MPLNEHRKNICHFVRIELFLINGHEADLTSPKFITSSTIVFQKLFLHGSHSLDPFFFKSGIKVDQFFFKGINFCLIPVVPCIFSVKFKLFLITLFFNLPCGKKLIHNIHHSVLMPPDNKHINNYA